MLVLLSEYFTYA